MTAVGALLALIVEAAGQSSPAAAPPSDDVVVIGLRGIDDLNSLASRSTLGSGGSRSGLVHPDRLTLAGSPSRRACAGGGGR